MTDDKRKSPEFRAKQAEGMRRRHADPEFRAKHAERMRRRNADPEFRAKQAEGMRRRNADPEFNPLAALTPEERAEYDILVKRGGYSRAEALEIMGKAQAPRAHHRASARSMERRGL